MARGSRSSLAFAIFFAAPVIWLILAPTKTDHALITANPFAFGDFHHVALAWKHLNAYSDHIYRRWIGNTLYYTLSATAITLVVSVPAGYGLAFGRFPGRKLVLSLTLVVMIVPAAALVLPIFLELNAMHLIGRSLSVILPFSFFPFGVYLAYIYYATSVPTSLLDAAQVDGAGELQTFLRVALPLAKPVVALVFFFSFVADWNNFFLPYVVLADSNQYPITVGLSDLARLHAVFQPGGRRRWPVGAHLQAGARAGDTDRGRADRDRLPVLPARARPRRRRWSGEGLSDSHG